MRSADATVQSAKVPAVIDIPDAEPESIAAEAASFVSTIKLVVVWVTTGFFMSENTRLKSVSADMAVPTLRVILWSALEVMVAPSLPLSNADKDRS